jgi:outer membrane protein assembly factor BamB
MYRFIKVFLVCYFLICIQSLYPQNWPQWRGPLATGAASSGNPPVEWSEQKNIKWKILLPGTGHSTPVVWGNTMFITAAIEPGNAHGEAKNPVKCLVMAVDRGTGKIKWQRQATEQVPHLPRHELGAYAAASPITDGKNVYAFFGSRGLYCYSIQGKLIWSKDFGDMKTEEMGEGNSPALYKDRLVIHWDHYGDDFITALQASTGEEIWRKKRNERISWNTPLIVEESGQVQVITVAEKWIQGYDLEKGNIIWKIPGTQYGNISSPVAARGILYVGSGLKKGVIYAIRLKGAKGDISNSSSILWSYMRYWPYVSSHLLLGNRLYFLKGNVGYLTCLDVTTGRPVYENKKLVGINHVFASPVGVRDRIYVLGRKGTTIVVAHGAEFRVLAKNWLDDKFDASPVVVDNEIYLRGHKYLYCISH